MPHCHCVLLWKTMGTPVHSRYGWYKKKKLETSPVCVCVSVKWFATEITKITTSCIPLKWGVDFYFAALNPVETNISQNGSSPPRSGKTKSHLKTNRVNSSKQSSSSISKIIQPSAKWITRSIIALSSPNLNANWRGWQKLPKIYQLSPMLNPFRFSGKQP